MLVQNKNNGVTLVYVQDIDRDHMKALAELGMCDESGHLKTYVRLARGTYVSEYGVQVPGYHFEGRSVRGYIINDSYKVPVKVADIARALNVFPRGSRYVNGKFTFVSPFVTEGRDNELKFHDSAGRGISINNGAVVDLAEIHDLMMHIGVNNGKLFEPVIARYVYTSREMPKGRPLIGYMDLNYYLDVIKYSRRDMFKRSVGSSTCLLYLDVVGVKDVTVKVVAVADGVAQLDIVGPKAGVDMVKANTFKPIVIFSLSPIDIRGMRFPWSRVEFDHTAVFMSPIMSKTDAWETLQGGIDLLSTAK